ncbi:hypothetical protein ACTMU2_32330 [Cupriavidus basilensis]
MKGGIAAAICGVAAAARQRPLLRRVAVSASVLEEVIEGHALASVLDRCQASGSGDLRTIETAGQAGTERQAGNPC